MFGSQMLEIVIGIVFVYLLLSLICSALNEMISRILSMRAKNLEEGIRNLLNDPECKGLAKNFYNHPLVKGLERKGKKPSYIPSRTFALALMDIVAPADSAASPKAFKDMWEKVAVLSNSKVKTAFLALMDRAENNLNKVRENIENWFDDAMQRVSGWYKRKALMIILILALAVTVLFNADTFMIANTLSRDATLRAAVVSAAEEAARQPLSTESESSLTKIKQLQVELQQLQLPTGWSGVKGNPREVPRNFQSWVTKCLGLLFTAIAVSLGAPFWFDVLNKFVNLRSSGEQPKKKALKTT